MGSFLYVLFLHKAFKIIVLTLTLSPCIPSFPLFLLGNKWMFWYKQPLFFTSTQHVRRSAFVNQNLFTTGSTREILLVGRHRCFGFTSLHESHCLPSHLGTTPSSLCLTEGHARLFLRHRSAQTCFSERL